MKTTSFNFSVAIQLAQASELAYGGCPLPNWAVGTRITPIDNRVNDIHAILIELPEKNIIAFRGTCSIHNWLTDTMIRRMNLGAYKVHTGFWNAHLSIRNQTLDILRLVDSKMEKPLLITGHSLGAALAAEFGLWIVGNYSYHIEYLYTFGEPRWCNWQGAKLYNRWLGSRTWRVVDKLDPVPMLPFLLGKYRHTQNNVWIDDSGRLEVMRPEWKKLPHQIKCLFNEYLRAEFVPIADHFISRYVDALVAAQKLPSPYLFLARK